MTRIKNVKSIYNHDAKLFMVLILPIISHARFLVSKVRGEAAFGADVGTGRMTYISAVSVVSLPTAASDGIMRLRRTP